MYFIYILRSKKDKRTYVGYTNDINRRLKEHNLGYVSSTRNRIPLDLMLKEKFNTKKEAKKRELWWKSGAGRRKLKEYFNTVV